MEYKVGQKVRIKPLEWFKEHTSYCKEDLIFSFCGEEATITGMLDLGYTLNIGLKGIVWSESCFDAIDINKDLVYQVTKNDLIGQIEDFPIEVVQKMIERQVEQGNKPDLTVFQKNRCEMKEDNGFSWNETTEGFYFWSSILDYKDFNLFFKKYPKQKQLTNSNLKLWKI